MSATLLIIKLLSVVLDSLVSIIGVTLTVAGVLDTFSSTILATAPSSIVGVIFTLFNESSALF